MEVLSGWRKISRNTEYEDLRHGETREEYLKPVYTKYGAHRVGNKNPGQIAKNNLDINTLTVSTVSMFNTRFSEWDEPSEPIYCKFEFADSKIGRDRPCELLSAHSHFRWSTFDNS